MSSTEFNIGLPDEKSSSRILKPPGGGHSNIFGAPEVKANPPRAKYNQQNSSNMNGVMGTTDPNAKVGQNVQSDNGSAEVEATRQTVQSKGSHAVHEQSQQESQQAGGRSRVPPGGFSSGLW